jgi:hypothetical protein
MNRWGERTREPARVVHATGAQRLARSLAPPIGKACRFTKGPGALRAGRSGGSRQNRTRDQDPRIRRRMLVHADYGEFSLANSAH